MGPVPYRSVQGPPGLIRRSACPALNLEVQTCLLIRTMALDTTCASTLPSIESRRKDSYLTVSRVERCAPGIPIKRAFAVSKHPLNLRQVIKTWNGVPIPP
jgi:hypothetical protein